MAANRTPAGLLMLATIALAVAGEVLDLTHTAGLPGLILLACAIPAGLTAGVAPGAPRARSAGLHSC